MVAPPGDHAYVNGPLPAVMLVDAVPFALPQVVLVELLERVIALVDATVTVAVEEQLFVPLTVTV